jgi:hypothetical protein
MREKEIEGKVCRYARSKNIAAYKFTSPARAAVPDRLIVYKEGMFFIEFKATGKKPTPQQEREHERLRSLNAKVFVVDNVDAGKFIIDAISMGVDLDNIMIC